MFVKLFRHCLENKLFSTYSGSILVGHISDRNRKYLDEPPNLKCPKFDPYFKHCGGVVWAALYTCTLSCINGLI